jgi:SAM-dependent methyltransferase
MKSTPTRGEHRDREPGDMVEQAVREYYNNFGWTSEQATSNEDLLFRRFRPAYYPYRQKVEDRIISAFSELKGSLLIAGCGDLPHSHVRLASQFSTRTCMDISQVALEVARTKLGDSASYVPGSIVRIPVPDDSFDAVLCAHVIYHVDIALQEVAVGELIRVTKPKGRIVIVYSNPRSLFELLAGLRRRLRNLPPRASDHGGRDGDPPTGPDPTEPHHAGARSLYFARHPMHWWRRFESGCDLSLCPGDVIGSHQEKLLIRTDAIGAVFYRACSWLEARFPKFAANWWQYPVIILDKKDIAGSA